MESAYRVFSRLPITATPSAPPVWRKVPLAADPTPVSPFGSEPMTDSVAAGIASPAPAPSSMMPGRMLV